MPPILSACLVLYRCGDDVDITLRCIQNADLEVSVYLSDNSPEEVTAERLKWAFPGVVVLPQEKNVGFSRASNAVLPILQSKYHLLLDPNVSFHPGMLRAMVSYMEAHPNIAVLSPRFFFEDGEELFPQRKQPSVRYVLGTWLQSLGGFLLRWQREYALADQKVEMPVPVDTAPASFMMIRTSVFQSLGGFDTRFSHGQADTDLCRRILDGRMGSIVYHPDMQVGVHNPAVFNKLRQQNRFGAVLRFLIKWGITW